ncbi:MAG: CocE/NonD family hydrolase [Actinobacteria bacterium]|nr:CocE/NonD family hydrolase [Actinomycetota bacterium]
MTRSPSRRPLTLLAVAGLLLGLVAAAPAGSPATSTSQQLVIPEGYEYFDAWYPSHDGVELHAGVYLPEDRAEDEEHPVLVSITPYTSPNGGARGGLGVLNTDIPVRFPEVFKHPDFEAGRWAYVAVDVRGFGGSGGCFQYYGQNEFLDTKETIDWAGTEPWSNGKVALWGKSYDSAQQVLALGSGSEHLAATVIQAPGLSGYTALWHSGVHYATGRYATTSVYTADDLFPPVSQGSATNQDYVESNVDGIEGHPDCRVDWQAMNVIGDRDDPYWADREPYRNAAGSSVPTLWSHGFHDANTKMVGTDIWTSLTGPKQAWFAQHDHRRGHEPEVGRDGFLDEAFRFLNLHVLGIESEVADPPVTVQSGGLNGTWRAEEQWPPADVEVWPMPLNPGTYIDEPQTRSSSAAGFWSTTPVLPHDVHIAGEMTMHVEATTQAPGAHLVVRVYDFDAAGNGQLVHRGAVALTEVGANEVSFTLYPQDFLIREGHRIGVFVNASEDSWYSPGVTQTTVSVDAATLDLPLLTLTRPADVYLEGDPSNFSSAGIVRVDPALLAATEVEGAIPPPMRDPE